MVTVLRREIAVALIERLFIGLNKIRLNRKKKTKTSPDKILILFSYCLQNSECPQKIVIDLANCKRCGKCVVKNLLELSEQYKVKCVVASGGEMALEKVQASGAEVVVAIACERELSSGIRGSFPRVVAAVPNKRPKGPCKDCVVESEKVEEMLRALIK